jgi:hypothetical protein
MSRRGLLRYAESRGEIEFKLLELTGLLVWSNLASQILPSAWVSDDVGIHWERVRSKISACQRMDWRKTGQYSGRTGTAGASFIQGEVERMIPGTAAGAVGEDSDGDD